MVRVLLAVPLFVLLTILFPVIALFWWLFRPVARLCGWEPDRRLRNRLRLAGRTIDEAEARRRLDLGEGTLLLQVMNSTGGTWADRAWWTSDALEDPPLTSARKLRAHWDRLRRDYFDPDRGRALLITAWKVGRLYEDSKGSRWRVVLYDTWAAGEPQRDEM